MAQAAVPKLRLGGDASARPGGRVAARSGTAAAIASPRRDRISGATARSRSQPQRSGRPSARSQRSAAPPAGTARSQRSQISARTPQSVREGSIGTGRSFRSELTTVDEMEYLRDKKERLTAELWDVMGEMSMEAAKRAGHRLEPMPSRARLAGTGAPLSLTLEAQQAFNRNRFGTTSQRTYNSISISGAPQLLNNDRRYARKATDMTRYGEARARSMKMTGRQ